ncbi:2-oxoacid:acceptor oxidoreductase family protein [Geobacter argillaceus]|uniref:2-oxoglutarate ferredoxin oxidoreductase subunit gamma n=1 Tax=Geobacter argillaceus TaxID=345631 RepID=A0A562VGX7_9BACT|nr:2-oxoacid:acceptor oxidoreductase family protein [Geobacter argillaceus]TWJ17074.1 2-oxoglutarate ferredoxin oxidoreductase subunit gamma [Geobacter argillaceus]
MRYDVFIAGFGGQGVLLAGNLLSLAAIAEGKNVCFFPSYGVEKRGGAAMCTVVIADGEVGSPVIGNHTVVIVLNQLSLEKYGSRVKPGGSLVINSSLIDSSASTRTDITTYRIPMNEIAMALGDARMVNMVATGAYVQLTGAVSNESLAEALKKALPERSHRFIPANMKAVAAGAQQIVAQASSKNA